MIVVSLHVLNKYKNTNIKSKKIVNTPSLPKNQKHLKLATTYQYIPKISTSNIRNYNYILNQTNLKTTQLTQKLHRQQSVT